MAQKLVVVESPAKAKTIEKYLGKDYKVLASVGHVRDLPESSLGVTVDNGFALEYVVNEDKHKVIDAIARAARLQYSMDTNARISRSRSTMSRSAGDWTLPADRP